MFIYARTPGGKLKDCEFNVTINISKSEMEDIIKDMQESGQIHIMVKNVEVDGFMTTADGNM